MGSIILLSHFPESHHTVLSAAESLTCFRYRELSWAQVHKCKGSPPLGESSLSIFAGFLARYQDRLEGKWESCKSITGACFSDLWGFCWAHLYPLVLLPDWNVALGDSLYAQGQDENCGHLSVTCLSHMHVDKYLSEWMLSTALITEQILGL
jgi:hypothetical protein